MFTINVQPGAVAIKQDSRELPGVLDRLTAIETTLEAVRVKLETLVPDTAQLEELRDRLKAQNDALQSNVAAQS